MTPKVSAIVPVYNPGRDIDDCIRSLLDQSLAPGDYEVIFVDDGSADGTGARLDALAAEHAHVRVEHIPNSGWPSRPRNVGLDRARGEYVYFVDNDDWVGREALERLADRADRDEADVVVGKVVGHGKFVARGLFRESRTGVTLDWEPLVRLLTPHKLFRRSFLDEHGIRFPEDGRRLEDHMFVMHAYFHARGISILADYPCYHWVLRSEETNASWTRWDPGPYYARVGEILELIAEHTEPGDLRDRLFAHWYGGKLLWRLQGGAFLRREAAHNRELYEEIHSLATARMSPSVERWLPFDDRVRSRVLREGDLDALEAYARLEESFAPDVRLLGLERSLDAVAVRLEARLRGLAFRRDGERLLWAPPVGAPMEAPEATDPSLEILVRSLATNDEYPLHVERSTRLEPAGDGLVTPVVTASARVDLTTAAAGGPLRPGNWQLQVVLRVAGFKGSASALSGRRVVIPVAAGGRIDARRWSLMRVAGKVPGAEALAKAALRRRG